MPHVLVHYDVDDKSLKFIRRFGEAVIVKTGDKIKNKLEDCGALNFNRSINKDLERT